MKVRIAASSPQDPEEKLFLSSYLIGSVAVDAGSVGLDGDPVEQARIRHVFLTHSHADHIGSLPVFIENSSYHRRGPVAVYGSGPTLEALRRDVFNNRIWPDLSRLHTADGPLIELHVLEAEKPRRVDGLVITPVAVNHTVPTFGYVVDDGTSAVVFGADSGPTERIWELARRASRLRAAFLECTFPVAMSAHAHRTGHLTPLELAAEMRKLPADTEVVAVHIRPAFRDVVASELAALRRPELVLGRGGATYSY